MDFLVEIIDALRSTTIVVAIDPTKLDASNNVWELHMDDSMSKEVSRVGLILKNLIGDEITYALRFNFEVYNKEAENEGLLVGLLLA